MDDSRFKFRYWWGSEKRYLKNSEIREMLLSSAIYMKADDSPEKEQALIVEIPGKLITEQCTGLKDSTGKLIYEGDLISIADHEESLEGWVVFQGGMFCFAWRFATFSLQYVVDIHAVNVIGNIHEEEAADEKGDWSEEEEKEEVKK